MATALPKRQQVTPDHRSRPVAAVLHAVDVLSSFTTTEPALSVTTIAARLGLHKSSVSRLLATLESRDLVERQPHGQLFRLGAGVVGLAAPLLASLDVRAVARPAMEVLAATTGASVSLAVWTGRSAVNVEQVLGPGSVVHLAPIGRVSPGHATANGKVFLAWLPAADLDRYLIDPLERFTSETITSERDLRRALEQVRRAGHAVNDGELDLSLLGVAAPVRDLTGRVVAAIGVTTGRSGTLSGRQAELARLAARTVSAGIRVSTGLGWRE